MIAAVGLTSSTLDEAEDFWLENCGDWDPMDDHAGIFDQDGILYKELEADPEDMP